MALVLAHPVRIGDARYRLGKNPLREVDATVPFRRLRRDLFERVGTLRRTADPQPRRRVNHPRIRSGGSVRLVPDVFFTCPMGSDNCEARLL